MMRDANALSSVQRAVAENAVARRFGLRHALDLHQPGPRYCTDAAANDVKRQAYLDSVRDLTERVAQSGPAGRSCGETNHRATARLRACTTPGTPNSTPTLITNTIWKILGAGVR